MPSQIRLIEQDASGVPTPPSGQVAIFLNDADGVPSMKDDTGTVTPLGSEGPAGPIGGSNTQLLFNDGGLCAGDSGATFDKNNNIIISQFGLATGAVRNITSTSLNLDVTHNGAILHCNNASAITITIPTGLQDAFSCMLIQRGAGVVTVVADTGVGLVSKGGLTSSNGQYSAMFIAPDIAADDYVLTGDLA